jgi:hypothetical protein
VDIFPFRTNRFIYELSADTCLISESLLVCSEPPRRRYMCAAVL